MPQFKNGEMNSEFGEMKCLSRPQVSSTNKYVINEIRKILLADPRTDMRNQL